MELEEGGFLDAPMQPLVNAGMSADMGHEGKASPTQQGSKLS